MTMHQAEEEYTKRPACPWLTAAQGHAGPDFRIYHVQPSAHQRNTLGRRLALSSESSARLLFSVVVKSKYREASRVSTDDASASIADASAVHTDACARADSDLW